MTDLHVADILAAAPPTLIERAREAKQREDRRESDAKNKQAANLLADFLSFCNDVLELTADELEFVVANHEAYDFNPKTPAVRVTLDGITIRARYVPKKIGEIKSSQFDSETIYDDVLTIETSTGPGRPFKEVQSLADLGRAL